MTAHSSMAGCFERAFSTSAENTFSLPDTIIG
jgi:hypothetical protein